MQVLLQNKQLLPEKFSAIGYGEYRPVAPNDIPEGRVKNRRVELFILPLIKDKKIKGGVVPSLILLLRIISSCPCEFYLFLHLIFLSHSYIKRLPNRRTLDLGK